MAISKRKKQSIKNCKEMSIKNTKKRVLREKPMAKNTKKQKAKIPNKENLVVEPKRRPAPSAATFEALAQKRARNRFLKLQNKFNLQRANLERSKKKSLSPIRISQVGPSESLYSPQSSLRIMREVGISKFGGEKLRHRAAIDRKPSLLASRRKIEFTQKELEDGMEYIVDGDVVRLKSISTAVSKRMNNLDSAQNNKALLSIDKGQGRVLTTLAFPFRHDNLENITPRPCSDSNHLILASWEGADKYDALKNRVRDIYPILIEDLKLEILLGGDLAYLSANFGCHPSMTQPCLWCPHAFDKSSAGEKNLIPFTPTLLPTKKKNSIPRRAPIWEVELGNIVPPILHIRLKLGNDLLKYLKEAAKQENKFEELEKLLAKCGLNKDRSQKKLIYNELNGGDVTKFSRSWEKFKGLCSSIKYMDVVSALSAFHTWSSLASKVDLHLTDDHLERLCCKNIHSDVNCCATSTLVKSLEKVGGFGTSVKVHVMAQHVGPFAWKHRMLGAVAEEGLERMHRTISDDLENISRKDDLERARIALLRWSVQVQLADLGKCID